MRLGILGSGLIVRTLMETIDKLPFASVCLLAREGSRARAKEMAARHGLGAVFCDYGALLDSGVDTVYVALPNALHYAYAKEALLRGKDVILEKPATANARELRELAALAKERGALLFEAMTPHYLPAFRAMREALSELGRVRLASFSFCQYSSRYDAFLRGETAPVFNPGLAGGALMDLNVYNLHAAIGLFGKPVSARYLANVTRGVDTSGVLTLQYPDFAAVCVAAKDCGGPNRCAVRGERGVLWSDEVMNHPTAFHILPNGGEERLIAPPAPEHRMYYEFMEFLRMAETRDLRRAEEMLRISLDAMEALDEARATAGIVFENDSPQFTGA